MIITVQNEYRVEAELSETELSRYGITYEELDYKNIETRRAVWSLFDDIKKKSGSDMSLSGKVLIEVMKEKCGLYKICFTRLSPHTDDKSVKQLVKSENSPISAQFDDFEQLLNVLKIGILNCYESSLYEKNGKYRLVFTSPVEEKKHIILVLGEFSDCKDNAFFEKAECEEHWNRIAQADAVPGLIKAFSVKLQPSFCRT